MRKLSFLTTRTPATEHEIRDFEARWELKLPAAFKEFCLLHNGGAPNDDFFPVEERFAEYHEEYGSAGSSEPCGVGVAWFEQLNGAQSIDATMRSLMDSNQLLPNKVPFAQEGCGNIIMLSVDPREPGGVSYWDHELQTDFAIADSFEQFLDGLTSSS